MNSQIQKMLEQAIKAFQEGNFVNADVILRRILQVDSKNFSSLHILGLIKASQSNFIEAVDYLASASKIQPENSSVHYNLAKALADSGNDRAALVHHKKAVTLAPNKPEAWLNYGLSISNLGGGEEAIAKYDRALSLNPNYAEAWLNKGIILKELKRFDEAIAHYDKALGLNPNYAEAWSNKGVILYELKRFDEAMAHFDKALNLNPTYAKAWSNKGIVLKELKRFDDAIAHFDKALGLNPNYAEAWLNKGVIFYELKLFDEAIAHYDKALGLNPNYAEAWLNKGVIFYELKLFDEAIAHYDKALGLNPNYAEAWLNKGIVLKELKQFDEALTCYDKALSIYPDCAEAWSSKGVILYELKRLDEAISQFDKALDINLDYAEAWSNKGVIFYKRKLFDEAITHYDKALILNPEYAEAWSNKGIVLKELKQFNEAINCYDKALSIHPEYAEAWSNKGIVLKELKQFNEAINCYDKALSIHPEYAEAWSNKGVVLYELKKFFEAIACYDKALSIHPEYAEAWSNKGVALYELRRFDEAIIHCDKALSLKCDIDWVHGLLLHTKMKVCSWSSLDEESMNVINKVLAREKAIPPFPLLAVKDDALLHKQAAEIFASDKYPSNTFLGPISKYSRKDKIRIAYFSPDFRSHPVSFLTTELFEIHNRNQFEVYAFSLQKSHDGDETTLRLKRGFDYFFDVQEMSEREIAQLARKFEIDIAIDLAGPTHNSKPGIFSYRAAPIQVNWLGYPGTMGADFMDYIVADKTIIPELSQSCFSEKIAYLPHTYMVDDSKRVASSRKFYREDYGLPEDKFIFCCFNNDYKFNPIVIDGWARILLAMERSILWISENNKFFKKNLIHEFDKRGIGSGRIFFAPRVELMSDHLARYSLADLFLDTHPYNAHTTAIDSLKAGVPIITLQGQSFASRVAASLLNAIGLPELIAKTQEEYEALALELAMSPKKIAAIKLKISNNYLTSPLFNTPLFTRNLEILYLKMYERYQSGLAPDNMCIV